LAKSAALPEYYPRSHIKHIFEALCCAKVPAAQAVQVVNPVEAEYDPAPSAKREVPWR